MTEHTKNQQQAQRPEKQGQGKPEPAQSHTARDGQITILADYFSLTNELIQPDQYVSTSRYFCLKWEPSLGLVGSRIVRVLRALGYYNRQTGEMRDGIPIDMPKLATLCGFSVATVKREFGNDKDGTATNPHLHTFVQREKNYKHDAVTGQIWREENIYRVKMDDPIHPDDLPRLQELWESRQKGGAIPNKPGPSGTEQSKTGQTSANPGMANQNPRTADQKGRGETQEGNKNYTQSKGNKEVVVRKAQNEPNGGNTRKAQNEPNGGTRRAHIALESSQVESNSSQSAPKSSQVESNSVQYEPALIDYSYLPKENLKTPSDAPEFSLSLFSRKGNTDTGNTDTGNTDTGNTDTGNTDTGNTDTETAKRYVPSHASSLTPLFDALAISLPVPLPAAAPRPVLWEHLPPEQQQPYRAQAKEELGKYAVEAGPDRWARIGPRQEEVRAKNMFLRLQSEAAAKKP